MDREIRFQRYTHYAVASVGGFFGGYAIINFYELFANAQSANMIHLVEKLVEREYAGLVYILASFFTYIISNVLCVLYKKFIGKNLRTVSLVLDALAVAAVGIIIEFTHLSVALMPIIFVMPIQWNAFSDDSGYASSTIFSTNNLRQTTMSLTEYILNKDKAMLLKTRFFGATLLLFHIGVALACFTSMYFSVHCIWFGFIPIALTSVIYILSRIN